jgi:putative Holliday junction resolvase
VRVLALDYGAARTGVAVSDETGTIASPLTVVERVDTDAGLARLLDVIAQQAPAVVVVGLPVSLDGREHAQAARTRAFARRLAAASSVPVVTYDERFTTRLAARRGGRAPLDARGAAVILEDFLRARTPPAHDPAAASRPGASGPGTCDGG